MALRWAAVAVLLLVSAAPLGAFVHRRNPRLPRFLLGRPPGGFLHNALYGDGDELRGKAAIDATIEHFNVTQPIDHTNEKLGTWLQRVQYNGKYFNKDADPSIVFLMIGGESIASDIWVSGERNYSYIRWAQKHGAAVFQLEHRFFGYSRPYNDMKTSSLKYCTMTQALEDTANFIRLMNAQRGFKNPKWITFGGSYPGALNAWFRQKYSDLTVGAVASSAIIGLKLDFYEYTIVVERTLRRTDSKCADNVQTAFDQIIKMALTAEGRAKLSTAFNLSPPFNEATLTLLDIQNFIANLYSEFQGVVQYTYDARNNGTMYGLNAQNLCKQITDAANAGDPLKQIKAVIDWEDTYFPSDGYAKKFPNSYSDMLSELKNETFDDETDTDRAAARGWMWLCCNEIGFLQTTDEGKNIFGSMVPLNYYVDMCTDMFGDGVTIETIRGNNEQAKKNFPGVDTYVATNVILPSGNLDPWSSVGAIHNDSSKHLYALVIDGTAHCADMYPVWKDEPPALAAARDMIEREVQYYVESATAAPPTATSTKSTKGASSVSTSVCSALAFTAFALLLR